MAVSLTVTRTTTLFSAPGSDADGDGQMDPGDRLITHILIVQNPGSTDALGVQVTDTLNGQTLLPGTVQVTPITTDDTFGITGNTPVTFTFAQLFGNDLDPDGSVANMTVSAVGGATNGAVSIDNAAHTVTFIPTTGLNIGATASFTYTVQDEQGLNNVAGYEGKVTLNISDVVWYVDGTYAGGGNDGSYLHPFTTTTPLSGAGDPDDPNETIFVYNHGTAGALVLEAGQKLYGDGTLFSANGHALGAGVTNTTLSASGGTVVTLSTDNIVKGITVNTGNATTVGMADGGISVSSTTISQGLLVQHVSFTGAGQAVDIDAGGKLNVTIDSLQSTGAGTNLQGVQLAGTASTGTGLISGNFDVTTGNIQAASSHDFQVGGNGASSGGTVEISYGGTLGSSLGGSAVHIADRIAGAGDVTFSGSIFQDSTASNATSGIVVTTVAAGNITFSGTKTIDTTGTNLNAVEIINNSGATVNLSSGALTITSGNASGGSGISIGSLSGTGTVNISNATTINNAGAPAGSTGHGVSIVSQSGGTLTFSGTLTAKTDNGSGINITGKTGGTDTFSGSTLDLTASGTGHAVNVGTSTGGTINFTGGALHATSANGTAFVSNNASTGTTLSVTGAGNTIVTTGTGNLVDIANTTIGTGGIKFSSIAGNSTNGAAGTAISINNLDKSGTGTFDGGTVTVFQAGGDGINITGSSADFTFAGATIGSATKAVTGDGIEIGGANGTITFTTVAVNQTGGNGVFLNGATGGAVAINGGTIGNLNDAAGDDVNIAGGSASLTMAAAITKTTTGNPVEVSGGYGGTANFTAAITGNTNSSGILVSANSGTVNFSNTITLNTSATNSVAFSASGGGTVTATGTGSTINSGNNTAINISSTTIGSGGVNFQKVDVNGTGGSTSAIILSSTGSTAGLTITGTGTTAGTGGTISNISTGNNTVDGISLSNTSNFNISNMVLNNFGGNAIKASNLGGVNSITGSTIENWDVATNSATKKGVDVTNLNTNMTSMIVSTSTFDGTSAADPAKSMSDAIFMEAQGTSNMGLKVQTSTFQHLVGDGVQVSSITGSTGTENVRILNNTFQNSVSSIGGGGVSLTPFGGIHFFADVNGNTFTNLGPQLGTLANTGVIGGTSGATAQTDITVRNNVITTVPGERGITFTVDGGHTQLLIDNNTIDGMGSNHEVISVNSTNNAGISTVGNVDVTISNNKLGLDGNVYNAGPSITATPVQLLAQFGGSMDALVTGNTVNASSINEEMRARASGTGVLNVTITNNNVTDVSGGSPHNEINLAVGTINTDLGGTINASLSGNLLAGGGATGVISFTKGVNGTPSIVVDQTDAANLSAVNNNATITNPANATYNGPLPTQPTTPTIPASPLLLDAAPVPGDEIVGTKPIDNPVVDTSAEQGTQTPAGDTNGGEILTPPAPDAGTPSPPAPTMVDDGVLSQAELGLMVDAAIQRWADAGATPEQIAAMRAVTVSLSDMAGVQIGSATPGIVQIDSDGAGYGWFVDSTPGEDGEFAAGSAGLTALAGSGAEGKVDLLTVLMHELGHQIGLEDDYLTADAADVMYGFLHTGERRLPTAADAAAATGVPLDHEAFDLTPVSVGTLPAGKAVEVQFQSTVPNYSDQVILNPFANTSTVSGSNFSNVTDGENVVIDSLTLGDRVFLDANGNSSYDSGEGVANVHLTLFDDTNHNNVYDEGTDLQLATAITDANGAYAFNNLAPGDYIVRIDASNFAAGTGALDGKTNLPGGNDADSDITDNDDNGVPGFAGAIVSQAITLAYNSEPTPGTGNDTNNTLDFGFASGTAPTGTDVTRPAAEDTPYNFATSDFGFGDTDGDSFTGVKFTTLPTGTVYLDTDGVGVGAAAVAVTTGQIVSTTYMDGRLYWVPPSNANATALTSFQFQVQDSRASNNLDLSANIFTFDVSAVNDAPVNIVPALAQTSLEDGTLTLNNLNSNQISISDVDVGAGLLKVTVSVADGTFSLAGTSGLDFSAGVGDGTSDPTMTFTGTLVDINTALNGIVYAPPGNFNGATSLTITTDDQGNTGSGGAKTDTDIVTINVTPINDEPAGGDNSATILEDASYALHESDFNFTDPLDNDAFAGIVVYSLPTNGTLLLNGSPVAANDFVNATDIGNSKLVFKPDLDESGSPYATFGFQVRDDGGTVSPGVDTDQSFNTFTFNVTAQNDGPAIDLDPVSGGTGANNGLFEQDPVGAGGIAPAATLTDPDSTDFDTGTLTVTIAANGQAGDVLDIINNFTDLGNTHTITTSSGTVLFDGTPVGTYTAGNDSTALVVTFNASATPEAAEWVLRAVNMTHTSDSPSSAVRSITYVVTDGDGGTGNTATATVNVTPANDAPALTAPTFSLIGFNENSGVPTPLMQGVVLSDPDQPASFSGGSLGVAASGGQGAIDLKAGSLFSIVPDGGGGFNLVYDNSGTPVTIGAITGFGTTNLQVTALTTGATQARLNDLVDDFTFIVAGDAVTTANVTITLTFNDGHNTGYFGDSALTAQQTQTVSVAGFNDAPAIDLNGAAPTTDVSLSYTENDPATAIAPAGTATDGDLLDFDTGTLTVQFTANGETADRLTILNQGNLAGQVGVSGANVSYGGTQVGSFTGGTDGSTPLVVTFNASAGQAAVQAVLEAVAYASVSDDPGTGDRTVTYTLTDGDGGTSNVATATIHVAATDDPGVANDDSASTNENSTVFIPILTNDGNDPDGPFQPGQAPKPLVTEVDGQAIAVGGTVTLTGSGAKVTLNADGTLTYDPNHKFDTLTHTGNPGEETGAVNTSAPDSFSYTVAGGDTATVSVTVNGVASAQDRLYGDSGDNTITGTPNVDIFMLEDGGHDTVTGLGNNDGFYFGGALDPLDKADGGAGTNDQLILQGDYSTQLTLGTDNLTNIEVLALLSGTNTAFGDDGTHSYSYNLKSVDANVGAGQRLVVDFTNLQPGENVTFDGSDETNGAFTFGGGKGIDHLTGGGGADLFLFRSDGRFGPNDTVNGGGGSDELALRGNYAGATAITFAANTMTNVEVLSILSGQNTRFGRIEGDFNYDITTNDNNVGNGQRLVVDAGQLTANETLTFNGSDESNGFFWVAGGLGNDHLTGGAGNDLLIGAGGADMLTGGLGSDTFKYRSVSESAFGHADTITDFRSGDIIDLSAIDADGDFSNGDTAFSLIGNQAFHHIAGELQAVNTSGNDWTISADIDGDGNADLQIFVSVADGHAIVLGDFHP
ncbi:MAG TPA: Ig-like domain-containing protein [Allosphingosinicella sp.]|jgi:hypothetical protein